MATAKSGKLFLVAGPSASGKSAVMSALVQSDSRFVAHRKGTTRDLRPDDTDVWSDHRLRRLEGNTSQVVYLGNGNVRYGIDVDRIRDDMAVGKNVMLVCVDYGMTEYLLGFFREQAVSVFVHRDFTPAMQKTLTERDLTGSIKRLVARARMYDQLAAGLLRPDYVVLNTGATIKEAVEQMRRIADAPHPGRRFGRTPAGMLHIIVSSSGRLKNSLEEAVWSYPGWSQTFIQKETVRVSGYKLEEDLPPGKIAYQFFGNEYRIDVKMVKARLMEYGVGFITVADIGSARQLQMMLSSPKNLFGVQVHYLHQSAEEISADIATRPMEEQDPRFRQSEMLLKLYMDELLLEAHPLLPVNGEENVFSWVQRCIRERPLNFAY